MESLRLKLRDLEITNRAKDYFIDQLKAERESFQTERQSYVERLISASREIGQLNSQLLLSESTSADKTVLPNALHVSEHAENFRRGTPFDSNNAYRADGASSAESEI